MTHEPLDVSRLRAEAASLRRLAVALAGEGAAGVVQDTWVARLAHPPARPGPLGGWLRVVLKNVIRKRRRSERRRAVREGEVAALAATPGPEELALRLEAQVRIGELVLALAEPYRST